MKKIKIFLANALAFILTQVFIFTALSIPMIFYGPLTNIRDLYVTTAMTTLSHQYLATIFLDDSTIKSIMDKNSIKDSGDKTDTSEITTNNKGADLNNNTKVINVESEKEIKPTNETKSSNEMKKVDISTNKYKGTLLIIDDPSKVKIASSKYLGNKGEKLINIAKRVDARAAINAGGFSDANGNGNGGTPFGLIIENSEIKYIDKKQAYFNLIGLNKNNILILGRYNIDEIKNLNIRDAISFNPYLIINGKSQITQGDGGWGLAPRTAIGQTSDGKILLLTIDGRQIGSIGASLKEVQDILLKYGAVNAANLDGGASTTMYYNGSVINKPSSIYGPRDLPSAFIVEK